MIATKDGKGLRTQFHGRHRKTAHLFEIDGVWDILSVPLCIIQRTILGVFATLGRLSAIRLRQEFTKAKGVLTALTLPGGTPFFCARPATLVPCAAPPGGSSRGTMSMRKSNWSDLLRAFAISARESVRRLFESAIMKARAVISAIKTVR